MKTENAWKEGDRSRAVCETCRQVVETRFEYRDYTLGEPRRTVPDVLVAVCTVCSEIVAVPFESSAALNNARRMDTAALWGVPVDAVTPDLAVATSLLYRRLKDGRVADVIRRPAPVLTGRSLLEVAQSGNHAELRHVVETMFALPR